MPARDEWRPPVLHELEAEIMDEVWTSRETTVRSVLEAINARHRRQRAYTTVMTIMGRLSGKGMLVRRRDGKTDVYTASLDREQYSQLRAAAEVEALVEQFGDVALVHFAREMGKLDSAQRDRLRRLAQDE